MIKKLVNWMIKRKTKNLTRIPLLTITFNWKHYLEIGEANSCAIYQHPEIYNDKELMEMLFKVIDYIRSKYDMERFTKLND